jgi:hypothetical protein
MSPTPETKGHPDPMTISEIAEMVGRSRQLVHRLAANDPAFPDVVKEPGSTRPRYRRSAVAEFWAAREAGLQQGRRTDIEDRQGTGMTAHDRKQQLIDAIRKGGGQWDATRAWEAYVVRPEDRKAVRRDLQALCHEGHLVRVAQGVYELAPGE